MNTRRCLNIANRIDALLQAEINHGIDPERMVADALYARDVLLVCKAIGSGELPELARMYRWAASAAPGEAHGNPSRAARTAPASDSTSSTQPGSEPARKTDRVSGYAGGGNSGRLSGRISGFFSSIFAPSTLPPQTNEPQPSVPPGDRARRPGPAR